ncbi:MAG: alpha/beta hydrolase [Halobacteriovoraceae bacterium]|nr:alpha/beta hydrolase [Halobacteriovoraceae bacterium]
MDFSHLFQMEIGEWKVLYKCITKPTHAHKVPVIFLSGGFNSFDTLAYETAEMAKDFPVYIVDLPGLGANDQMAGEINEEDYSLILKNFLDNLGIDRVHLIGQSYSSSIAFTFASYFNERVQKLVLSGITGKMRESVRYIIEDSLHHLQKSEVEKFASSIVLNMMNFSQRHNIQEASAVNQALYENLLKFNDNDKRRYHANFSRLANLQGLPRSPQCDVLVISGEFDNFTTPYENFQVARACPSSTYVVVKGTDHLASHEKKDVMTRLYRRYLTGSPLNRMKDVEVMEKDEFPRERIRMEPRWLLNDVGFLDSGNGVFVPVNIVDINNFGCRLYTSFKDHKSLKRTNKFVLHIPEEDMQVEVILFKQADNGHYRGIFKHFTFDKTKQFEGFIDKVAMSCTMAYAA